MKTITRFAGWALFLALVMQIAGCCHDHVKAEELERARAQDFKDKWVQEVRFHYQTQLIKSKELEEMAAMLDELRAENEELKKKLNEKKAKEVK